MWYQLKISEHHHKIRHNVQNIEVETRVGRIVKTPQSLSSQHADEQVGRDRTLLNNPQNTNAIDKK